MIVSDKAAETSPIIYRALPSDSRVQVNNKVRCQSCVNGVRPSSSGKEDAKTYV